MKIEIKGVIVPDDDAWIYDLFDMDSTSPAAVQSAIDAANGDDLDVDINSGGGDVFSGSAIYAKLRSYTGNVRIHVTGLAASAASVIAMAGHSDIAPTAQIMVHNVSTYADGDYHDMQKARDMLKQANRSIAAAYAAKSGMSEHDALDLMDAESWLTAQDAVDYGLIDEIAENHNANTVSADDEPVRFAASASGMLPHSVIAKMQARRQALIDYFTSTED